MAFAVASNNGSIAIISAPYTGASQSVHPQMPWLSRSTLLNSKVYHSMSRCRMPAPKVINTASPHFPMVIYAEAVDRPHLKDLPMHNYINNDGMILPPVEPGTAATVFAVFDNAKKAQYVGFSKDIRNSLRTLIGRRPEFCHFYKLYNLPTFDQQKMLSVRQQWFSELGSAPRGNTDNVQRNMWEKPADAGSISERGKLAAATSRAKTLLQTMMDKGLKEKMVYDPALLEQGKCDILPARELTADELEETARLHAEQAHRSKHCIIKAPCGESVEFDIFYEAKYPTNAGWMYDVSVTKDAKETRHRVICGSIYPEAAEMHEDEFVETVFAFLLYSKIQRHTEGIIARTTFPINYFAVGEVELRFDEFKAWFSKPLPSSDWRFKSVHKYGAQIDPAPFVGPESLFKPKTQLDLESKEKTLLWATDYPTT